jgi:hypothetical protein
MSAVLTLLAAGAATMAPAACGDDPKTPEPYSGSATSNEQDAARVKLLQCAREQGVDVPDASATGEAFGRLSPAERDRLQAAIEGPCREYAARAFGTAA